MKYHVIALLALSVGLSFTAHAKTGLSEKPHKKFDYLALSQSIPLKKAATLYISAPVAVSFDKKWLHQYRRELNENYKTRTRSDYGEMLTKRVSGALGTRFTLVDKPEKANYIANIGLSDLRINGPGNDMNKEHFVRRAGSATLNVTLLDAISQEPIMAIRDKERTRDNISPNLRPATRVFNRSDFNILFKRWAKNVSQLVETL